MYTTQGLFRNDVCHSGKRVRLIIFLRSVDIVIEYRDTNVMINILINQSVT